MPKDYCFAIILVENIHKTDLKIMNPNIKNKKKRQSNFLDSLF